MSEYVVKQRWRSVTGSRKESTHISVRIRDSSEIPTATPMFPGSGNTDRLQGILSYAWGVLEVKDGGHMPEVDMKLRVYEL